MNEYIRHVCESITPDINPVAYPYYREDIVEAFRNDAVTNEEFNALLDAFWRLKPIGENYYQGEQLEQIKNLWKADYELMLLHEAMEGDVCNPLLMAAIHKREVAAGRMAELDEVTQAMYAVTGDPIASRIGTDRPGDKVFRYVMWGTVALFILDFLLSLRVPGWLYVILVIGACFSGYYLNDKRYTEQRNAIQARRAAGQRILNGQWVQYQDGPIIA